MQSLIRRLQDNDDLLLATGCALLLVVLVSFDVLSFVRIPLGSVVVLAVPGYVGTAFLFPRKSDLSTMERIVLSIGLSIALVVAEALVLNFTPWGIRPLPVASAIVIMTAFLALGALNRRRFLTSTEHPFHMLSLAPASTQKQDHPRGVLYMRHASIILACFLLIGAIMYRMSLPAPGSGFTEFALLDKNGLLRDYPTFLHLQQPTEINISVGNWEDRQMAYDVRADLAGQTIGEISEISLNPGEQWTGTISVTAQQAGRNQRLDIRLISDSQEEPVESLHLWVDVLP